METQSETGITPYQRDQAKFSFATVIRNVRCEDCNEPKYSISDFSDEGNLIIAHLKCLNCGSTCEYTLHPTSYGGCTGIKSHKSH